MIERSLAFILAGGSGNRLFPLTRDRAKPAVPFSRYRVVDHNTSHVYNAGVKTILFPVQFEQRSLLDHLDDAYPTLTGERKIRPIPPTQRRTKRGIELVAYSGTADAVFQNLKEVTVYNNKPEHVLVFSADHITDIDVREIMLSHHREDRDLTIAVEIRKVRLEDFEERDGKLHYKYGVILCDKNNRVTGFNEKPTIEDMPRAGEPVLVSMGNYIFHSKPLVWALEQNFGNDFGNHVIPGMVKNGKNVFVYKFKGSSDIPGDDPIVYWRDIGDIPSYFQTCMDLNDENPKLNYKRLIEDDRPVITVGGNFAPIKFVMNGKISTISEGCEVYGQLENCVLSQNVLVGHGSFLRNTVVFPNVEIEPGANIQNAIIDKNNIIHIGSHIGYDRDDDKKRGYTVVQKNGTYLAVVPRVDPR